MYGTFASCSALTSSTQQCAGMVTYSVNGQVYSKQMSFGASRTDASPQKVKVWYNPASPSDAVIDRPLSATNSYALAACLVLVLIAMLVYARAVLKSRRLAAFTGATDLAGLV